MWQRGLLNLIDFEGWIHRNCLFLWSSDVFFFWIHRNLMVLGHPDVSGMCGFGNIHRKCPSKGLSDVLLLWFQYAIHRD